MMIGVMVSSGLVLGGTARRSKGVIWAVFHSPQNVLLIAETLSDIEDVTWKVIKVWLGT